MDFRKLNTETWKSLDSSGTSASGYKTTWLVDGEMGSSPLHIFKDETGKFHLTIEVEDGFNERKVIDPKVNGLSISINHYRLDANTIKRFVDIRCNQNGYLNEFTQVTGEICQGILVKKKPPLTVINEVITKWITFWNSQKNGLLTEEQIIGLMCELNLLRELCLVDPVAALNSWVGPFNERHDFVFPAWTFEVKCTRRAYRTHTINGVDQLKPFPNKSFGFVSYIITVMDGGGSVSLPGSINSIYDVLLEQPELTVKFNELLIQAGYSPLYNDEYDRVKIELLETTLFAVDDNFPCLTTDYIVARHMERISYIRYDISLEGLLGKSLNDVHWEDYFGS
jgi:hypothetical protein